MVASKAGGEGCGLLVVKVSIGRAKRWGEILEAKVSSCMLGLAGPHFSAAVLYEAGWLCRNSRRILPA